MGIFSKLGFLTHKNFFEFFNNKRFFFYLFIYFGSFSNTYNFFNPKNNFDLNGFFSFYEHLIFYRRQNYQILSLFFFVTDELFLNYPKNFKTDTPIFFEFFLIQLNFLFFKLKNKNLLNNNLVFTSNYFLNFYIFINFYFSDLLTSQWLFSISKIQNFFRDNYNFNLNLLFFFNQVFLMFLSFLNLNLNLNFSVSLQNLNIFYFDVSYFKNNSVFRSKLSNSNSNLKLSNKIISSNFNYINFRLKNFNKLFYFSNNFFLTNYLLFKKNFLVFLKIKKLAFVHVLNFKINYVNFLKKPSDISIFYLPSEFTNSLIFFIRKQKLFNKGRYSRNRQNYRTGVYWCLWVNIIAVAGFYFWFYRFTMNLTYIWLLFFACLLSFFFSQILKNRMYTFNDLFFEFSLLINWFSTLLIMLFTFFLNLSRLLRQTINNFFSFRTKHLLTNFSQSFEFFLLNKLYIII